jgi:type IV pilus assembly protein PilV
MPLDRKNLKMMLHDSKGFSIVEVLIALSVFMIGILAVGSMTINSINENASARKITEATNLAEQRLERIMALSYDSIIDDEIVDGAYTISWDVTEDAVVVGTKSVVVTVKWLDRGEAKQLLIRHLISPSS